MKIVKITADIAQVKSENVVITDVQSALDVVMSVEYEAKTNRIIMDKSLIEERFFDLKTGVLGEVFQKFITYGIKVAVVGDFSLYSSKSLKDYIKEANRGHDIFFVTSVSEAIAKLSR